jgi:DNA-binding response OmpR family regulator
MDKRAVLVADDEELVRHFLTLSLTKLGFRVLTAESPGAAIDLASSQVELAIIGVKMPALAGLETVAALQKMRPGLPIIISSGEDETDLKVLAASIGATDYLIKPYRYEELAEKVVGALSTEIMI